jgi:hypothetical protein
MWPGRAGGRHAEGRGYGLIFFAAILLLVVGFFNMIYGIAATANSHVFVAAKTWSASGRAGETLRSLDSPSGQHGPRDLPVDHLAGDLRECVTPEG